MGMQEGTLTWPYVAACDPATEFPQLSPEQQAVAVRLAVEWMWSRSGRRYGTRPVVYRPAAAHQPHRPAYASYGYGYGAVTALPWQRPGSRESRQVLELPPPVASVESVTINGAPLDPQLWRVDGRVLVRQDGGDWPQTQTMIAALGSPDTWAVNYTRGYPVPIFGQYATGRLVCYFDRQMSAGKPCELPYNTTTVSRGGVTINRDKGKAGQTSPVPEVEQWLAMVNPDGLRSEPAVWSPDFPRASDPYPGSYTTGTVPPVGQASQFSVLVLPPDADVPPGTPPGTVILWTDGTPVGTAPAPHLVVPEGGTAPATLPSGTVLLQTES